MSRVDEYMEYCRNLEDTGYDMSTLPFQFAILYKTGFIWRDMTEEEKKETLQLFNQEFNK